MIKGKRGVAPAVIPFVPVMLAVLGVVIIIGGVILGQRLTSLFSSPNIIYFGVAFVIAVWWLAGSGR